MRCPLCGFSDTIVKSSRPTDDSTIRRRRFCMACSSKFSTIERVSLRDLVVLKRNGRLEPFDQEKIVRSMKLALHKRPVDPVRVDRTVTSIVRQLESCGETEISSSLIGDKVLASLSSLDSIGYVRFASLYCKFQEIKDFLDFLVKTPEEDDDHDLPIPASS